MSGVRSRFLVRVLVSRRLPEESHRIPIVLRALLAALVAGLSGLPIRALADSYFYDPGGRLTGIISQASGGSAQYQFDHAGNVIGITREPSTVVTALGFGPVSGPAGTSVTISGTDFGSSVSGTSVSFNGTAATVMSVSANSIVASVPAGASSGPITVTVPGGSATTAASFTIAAAAAPAITSFSSAVIDPPTYDAATQSWTPGTAVTVNGTGFSPTGTKVYIGGRLAVATNVSATSLTLAPPVVGSGPISVVTQAGTATASVPLVVMPYVTPIGPGVSIVGLIDRTLLDAAAQVTPGIRRRLTSRRKITSWPRDSSPRRQNSRPIQMLAEVSYTGATAAVGDPIYLTGPDGLQVNGQQQAAGGQINVLYTLTPNRIYTLFVGTPKGVQPASATITVETVPAAATASVTPSQGGGTATVALASYQVAEVSFHPPTNGDRVSLLTQEQGNLAQNPFIVSMTAPDGFTQIYTNFPQTASAGEPITSGMTDFSGPRSVTQNGSYTIGLQPHGTAPGNAEFTLYDVPPDQSGALHPGTPLSLTTTVPGQGFQPGFAGEAGEYGTVLTTVGGTLEDGCFTVSIAAPSAGTVYSNFQCGGTTDFSGQVELPATGTYTVSMRPAWTGVGEASFTLSALPAPSSGSITIGGAPVTAPVSAAGQAGSLSFTSTGQWAEVSTSVSGLGGNCLLVSLAGAGSPAPITLYDQCNQASESLDSIYLPANASGYQLLLQPVGQWTGSIVVTLANGTPLPAATIPDTGAPVLTAVGASGPPFSLAFQGAAGSNVALGTQPIWQGAATPNAPGNCYQVAITDPNGASVYNSDSAAIATCRSPNWSGVLDLAVTGQYTMTFTPRTAAAGAILQQLFLVPANGTGNVTLNGPGAAITLSVPGQTAVGSFTVSQQQFSASPFVETSVGADPNLAQGCYQVTVQAEGGSAISSDQACGTQYQSGALQLPGPGTYQVLVTAADTLDGTASINVGSR